MKDCINCVHGYLSNTKIDYGTPRCNINKKSYEKHLDAENCEFFVSKQEKQYKWKKYGKLMMLNMENCYEQYRQCGYPHRTYLQLRCQRCGGMTIEDSSCAYPQYCPNCGALMKVE